MVENGLYKVLDKKATWRNAEEFCRQHRLEIKHCGELEYITEQAHQNGPLTPEKVAAVSRDFRVYCTFNIPHYCSD